MYNDKLLITTNFKMKITTNLHTRLSGGRSNSCLSYFKSYIACQFQRYPYGSPLKKIVAILVSDHRHYYCTSRIIAFIVRFNCQGRLELLLNFEALSLKIHYWQYPLNTVEIMLFLFRISLFWTIIKTRFFESQAYYRWYNIRKRLKTSFKRNLSPKL